MKALLALAARALVVLSAHAAVAATGTITTFAGGGSGIPPGPPSPATSIMLNSPVTLIGLAFDGAGNYYFADSTFYGTGKRIFKVTAAGLISVLVENAGDVGGLTADSAGNVYYSDPTEHRIKRADPAGVVTVLAGSGTAGFGGDTGPATAALVNRPRGIALIGTDIVFADAGNFRIRRITAGIITTVAGTGAQGYSGDGGLALSAQLNVPGAMVADGSGGYYFADMMGTISGKVRHVSAAGTINLVASASDIEIVPTTALARDTAGNLYFEGFQRVYKVDAGGTRTIIAGSNPPPSGSPIGDGGPATAAVLFFPRGLAVSGAGDVYITDSGSARIRKIDAGGIINTVAGGGTYNGDGQAAGEALFNTPVGVSIDAASGVLVADTGAHRVRRVDAGAVVSTFAGSGTSGFAGDGGQATSAALSVPRHAVVAGGHTYIADGKNRRVRRVDGAGVIATVAGSGPSVGFGMTNFLGDHGPATSAKIGEPAGLAFDSSGALYLAEADGFNFRVRKVGADGIIDTAAGNGTAPFSGDNVLATLASLSPEGLAFDAGGNLYLTDGINHRIRKVDTNGIITTFAGTGVGGFNGDGGPATAARLFSPRSIVFDPSGNLYIADSGNERIRMVSPDGVIQTVAGTGTSGFGGDGGPATAGLFSNPVGLAWHAAQSALLVADAANRRVRKIAVTDTTPAAFSFTAQSGVPPLSVVQSAGVTPASFDVAAPVTVSGGEYSAGCTGTFTTAAGTLTPGQTVCVRHTSLNANNANTTTSLTVGGVRGDFVSTTLAGPGVIGVAPSSIDFGTLFLNHTPETRQVTISNTGGSPLTIHSITAPFPFSVTHNCGLLDATGSCIAQVGFSPATPAPQAALLTIQVSSGTQTVALAGAATRSLTSHYYQSILRRPPDSGGLAFWDGEATRIINAGANVNEVWFAMAMQFFFSAEYAGLNRDNTAYVTDLYATFFDRTPDSGGLAFWKGQLDQGMPREVLLAAFMFSPEFVLFTSKIFGRSGVRAEVDLITDFYRGLFARLPDNAGLAHWVGRFRAAQCAGASSVRAEAAGISGEFIGGPEYVARNRTDAQYVGDLYNAFLRRGGDLPGVQYWIGQLSSGARTRANVLAAFVSSGEFGLRVARVLSEGCLAPGAPVPALYATLQRPGSLAIDTAGNAYFAEDGSRVRRISASGMLTTHAELSGARSVAVDAAGNVYVSAAARVHRIDTSQVVSVVAGDGTAGFSGDEGPATAARLGGILGVALDSAGNLLIADYSNHRVRKVSSGVIRTVAGNGTQGTAGDGGPALQASFYNPVLLVSDGSGGFYVEDHGPVANIRRVDAAGTISAFATTQLTFPEGLARDSAGNLYLAGGSLRPLVYKFSPAGAVTTFAGGGSGGDGVPATSARLDRPAGVAVSPAGELYISDLNANRIRKVGADGTIRTVAGATYP